jgi:hypothetical protein
MNIGFFVRHFTERGTEVAIYDYAKYNEDILHHRSYIICFTPETQHRLNFPTERQSYHKFKARFPILEINDIRDMESIIQQYKLSFFHTLTHGGQDMYAFEDKQLWGNCKTIKHCVFDTSCPEGDYYISIGQSVNSNCNTHYPVIPHMVDLPHVEGTLRDTFHIPSDSIVYGRYGGFHEFNIPMVHQAIQQYLDMDPTCYFLFMNTHNFYDHPRIIYVEQNVNMDDKVKFINTCDAMIHAREMGETFGLSIAEFSIKNKPIITCTHGYIEHIRILGEKAILYDSVDSLLDIFKNIQSILSSRTDWNAYRSYSPDHVMCLFQTIFSQSDASDFSQSDASEFQPISDERSDIA